MKLSTFLLASIVYFAGVKAQSPYPDDQFFIEHAHSELVADVKDGTIQEGQPIILYNEGQQQPQNNQLWTFTHEGYIKSSAGDFYLAIQDYRGQAIADGTAVILSKFPQIWEYYNGAVSIPGLHYGISYTGDAAANVPLVIKALDIFDKTQQFRLERLFEEQQGGQVEAGGATTAAKPATK